MLEGITTMYLTEVTVKPQQTIVGFQIYIWQK